MELIPKKLLIAPHIDDEILGCGGILNRGFHILHCGCAESQNHGDKIYTRSQRIEEFDAIASKVGFTYNVLSYRVNEYIASNLIPSFEGIINEIKPYEIFIPHPSYNQDHRAVYEAALVALRPHDINHFVKKVLVYEQEHVLFWNHNYRVFNPTYFKRIDIAKKLDLYKMLKSQVRTFRSPEKLEAMAKVRGAQANCEYAEAFEVLRWVE